MYTIKTNDEPAAIILDADQKLVIYSNHGMGGRFSSKEEAIAWAESHINNL